MRSEARSVDEYLAETPEERRATLSELRDACRELLPDHEESMRWGMAAYLRGGEAEFAWASQARYISLF
jgi:uncharacterized protein YdhG (YjbR/CyaY superfamily)